MEVILKETIDTLGQEGQIVKVKPGYARNYLIPQSKAVPVNNANLARLKQEKATIANRLAEEKQKTDQLMAKLDGKVVSISRKVGEEGRLFGSVTTTDVAAALEAAGTAVERKNIQLAEPIKALGEHKVGVKVGFQAIAQIKVQVVPETIGDQE